MPLLSGRTNGFGFNPFMLLCVTSVSLALTGCVNLYSPIDSPSGSRQLLSAARAAFDKGDAAKAREFYEKIGSDETAQSEIVFLNLDACGADIDAFGTALSKGADSVNNPGIMLTIMAEKMNAQHSTACFASLLSAYKTATTLKDKNLRGFTSFLSALAIAGEVLANNSGIGVNGEFEKADYLALPSTSCTIVSCGACLKADGITTGATVNLATANAITANWGTVQGAVTAISTALSDLGVSQGASLALISQLGGGAPGNNNLYRCLLNDVGVGR